MSDIASLILVDAPRNFTGPPMLVQPHIEVFFVSLPAYDSLLAANLILIPGILGWLARSRIIVALSLAVLSLLQFSGIWSRMVDWSLFGQVTEDDYTMRIDFNHFALFAASFGIGLIFSSLISRLARKNAANR